MTTCTAAVNTSEKLYSFYSQKNDDNPWLIGGIDFPTYIKLKHSDSYALEYVKKLIERNEMPAGSGNIERLYKSIDGIEFDMIYENDSNCEKGEVTNVSIDEKVPTTTKNMSVELEEISKNSDVTCSVAASELSSGCSIASTSSDSQDVAGESSSKGSRKQHDRSTQSPHRVNKGITIKDIAKKTFKTQFKAAKPKKSGVLTYFVKMANGGTCKLCHMDVKSSGNTTNLTNHLVRRHQHDIAKNQDIDDARDEFKAMFRRTDESNPDDPELPISSATDAFVKDDCGKTSQPRIDRTVRKISSFKIGGSKAGAITNALVYMAGKDDLPISTTEKIGFKYFMSVACPLYEVPKRTAMTAAIDRKYEILSSLTKEKLAKIAAFTLAADIWTDTMTSQSFLGCTAHFLRKMSERHTSAYIQRMFESMCATWKIPLEKVTAIVTDNGANIVKAAVDTFGGKRHFPCFAHTLNLVLAKVIGEMESLKDLIARVKSIVTFFKHSTPADLLRKSQKDSKRLNQEVPTRWNSTFYMVERFLELIDTVTSVLLTLPQSPPLLTASEVAILRDSMQVLEPAEFVTRELSGQGYVTSSRIVPTIYCLKKAIEEVATTTEVGATLKCDILKELEKRFKGIELNPLSAIATLLDPRYKRLHFSPLSAAKTVDNVNVLLKKSRSQDQCGSQQSAEHPRPDSAGGKIWKHHTELVKLRKNFDSEMSVSGGLDVSLKQYLVSETVPLSADPIKYWSERKENSPELASVALKYLTTVAISVPCERLFSMAGNVATPKRNRLTGQHLSRLLFLKSIKFEEWRM